MYVKLFYAVAVAPKNNQRRVQSLIELDDYMQSTLPSGETGGAVALALLTASLSPPETLQEADEIWDFDVILQEISQQMQSEAEALVSKKGSNVVIGNDSKNVEILSVTGTSPPSGNKENDDSIIGGGRRRNNKGNNTALFAKYSSTEDPQALKLDDDEGK